ncbi:Auxin-responsive protein SAUR71 [Striga hermonthica]|uniref:Auxin-responsive protein SAUR71 n=1 Tax=Striga hermonthica TaxID=68872 RepID=A0A9N7NUT5_STRHE|nr:Auxin-responsive protein SAUR71 [Striga hermonthica]
MFGFKKVDRTAYGYEKMNAWIFRVVKRNREIGTPKGHVPVCVGPVEHEAVRYLVPIAAVNSRAFVAMLDEVVEDGGRGRVGPLQLPCSVEAFQGVLDRAFGNIRG